MDRAEDLGLEDAFYQVDPCVEAFKRKAEARGYVELVRKKKVARAT